MFELLLGEHDIPREYEVNERTAVRAVIFKDDYLLMVKNNRGDFKFPGGGVGNDEDLKSALLREVAEETGYVNIEVETEIGQVIQQHIDDKDNSKYFRMKSIYYLCKLKSSDNIGQNLDDYETEQEFTAQFVKIEEAINTNKKILGSNNGDKNNWVERETKVLEIIRSNISNRE